MKTNLLLSLLSKSYHAFTPNESVKLNNTSKRQNQVHRKSLYLIILFLAAISNLSYSQTNTWDGSSNANWNTAANWSLNVVPLAAHDVVIPDGITAIITVNSIAVCKTLTLTGGGNSNSVVIADLQSLSVTGAITLNAGTGGNDHKIISVGTAVLNCASITMASTGSDNRTCEVNVTTGIINVTGDITMNGTAARNIIRFSGAGLLNLGGSMLIGGSLIPSTGTVNCNGAAAQTLSGQNTTSFYNLSLNKTSAANIVTSNTNAFTVANNLTINQGNLVLQATDADYTVTNDISIAANGTLTHSVDWIATSRLLSVAGSIAIDGLFTYTVGSHVQMIGGASENIRTGANASSAFSYLSLKNGNYYATGTVRVNNIFTAMSNTGGSFHTNGQAVYSNASLLNQGGTLFVDGGSLNVTGGVSVGVSGSNGTVNIATGTFTSDGIILGSGILSGTIIQSGGTTSINGNLLISTTGTYTCSNAPIINISGNWTNNSLFGNFTPAGSTVVFNSNTSAQNITGTKATQVFNNVTVNKAGQQLTVAGSTTTVTLNGSLNIAAGIFAIGTAANINIAGNWSNSANFSAGSGRVTFNGSVIQLINGSTVTSFNNLTLNNAAGLTLSGVDASATGGAATLTLTNGKITTGANKIILGNTGTISGASANRYVYGKLQLGVAMASPTRVFEIGDAVAYAPVSISFNAITSPGTVTAFTVGTEHPLIISSIIDDTKSVNRYWNLTSSGLILTSFVPTFNFLASDVDAGSNTAGFIIGRRSSSWAYPTMGVRNPTNTTATLGSFGEYAIGEGGAGKPVIVSQPTDQTLCSGVNTSFTASATNKPSSTVQWMMSTNGGVSYTNVPAGSPYSIVTSTAGNVTTSTLTINPVSVAMNTYEYQAIFTNTKGSATSFSAALRVNESPTVSAGASLGNTICGAGTSDPLNGSIGGSATSATWTTPAGGTFNPGPTALNATWTPPFGYTGTAIFTLTTSGGLCGSVSDTSALIVNPIPGVLVINPSSASICNGAIQSLTVTNSTTTSVASGTINLAIPNNNVGGITNTLAVTGIPTGATINSISVTLNVSHNEVADLIVNLRAPNGNILNLVNRPAGGSGVNFTNTIVSSSGITAFTSGSSPFTGTFAAAAVNAIGATGQISNVTNFSSLFGTPNGSWIISARDAAAATSGSIISWTISVNWTDVITWAPVSGLYSNAAATIPYNPGQNLKTVYAKPSIPGPNTYTATETLGNGCTTSRNVTVTTNPIVTVTADYCVGGGRIELTAVSTPAAVSYLWNTGETTQRILVDLAGIYQVTVATGAGCVGTGSASIARELIVNGDFTMGNVGFTSAYGYVDPTIVNGMYPEEKYTVNNDPNINHNVFFGRDHTSNTGNFMIINGSGSNPPINVWQESLSVQPNTDYYFSAWAISLNSVGPFANLQFKVNGAQIGTTTGALPARPHDNNPPYNWVRFYGSWNSGAATTAAVSIVDLEQAFGGNDFGLDDISFGTLSTFITFTGATGTNYPTVCVNTPLTPITYSVGSGAGGPVVTGLPPGVTSTFDGVGLVILGTPTAVGTYNYTITISGTCNPVTATGRIIVNQQSLVRTSASATTSQIICINTPVTPVTYAVGGSATGATVTGLPAGVTGSYSGGIFTISGSPTVGGIFNYTITNTGPCTTLSTTGTIAGVRQIITRNSAAGTNMQRVCINTPIINITYQIGGTATGGFVTGLPAGVSGVYNSVNGILTISGTPTVAGVFNYTVTTSGTCAPVSNLGSITVNTQTVILASGAGTDAQVLCVNTPITEILYSIGGSATSATVTGLPAGVTGTYDPGFFSITGVPTVVGVFNYTITPSGTCASTVATGSISVNNVQTIVLTSAPGTNSQTICAAAITPITYNIGGGGTGAGITGLPPGVSGSYSGGVFTISGSPLISGVFNYTITTTGTCTNAVATGSISVTVQTIALTSAVGSNSQASCINTPISGITYAVGGTGTGATVSGLPPGVTGSFAGSVFTISGTPTVAGLYNYIVTTTGTCSAATASGSITVTAQTISLTSGAGSNSQVVCLSSALSNIIYSVGGTATGATVSGLPAGVTGSYSGGNFTISGTPAVSGIFNYTVTTTGTCSPVTATGSITVTIQTIALTSGAGTNNQTSCINTAISNVTYAVGGSATGATVTGLPGGVSGSYAGNVFTISGTPATAGIYNYTVTTSGTCANITATGTFTVTAQTITLTSAAGTNTQTRCVNTVITSITYSIGGTATGATISGLPAGVTGSLTGAVFTISGTPTVSGVFNYAVTTTGTCSAVTATGSITVTAQTIGLTSAAGTNTQINCINTAITNITYSAGGTATGATVTGLPPGVSGSFAGGTFTISGTPSTAGLYNYTVTTSGTCSIATATGSITVTAQTIALSSAAGTSAQTLCINTGIANITYSIGGTATGVTVTGLPAGVSGSFASAVFTISGTPAIAGVFNYVVTTTGTCSSVTATGSITVNAQTIALTSAAGSNAQTRCINTAITNITYSVGGTATGATVTGLPAGITGSFSGTIFTITGTPAVGGVFNYTITTTGTCSVVSATGSITVTAQTIALTSAAGTNAQVGCVNTAISNIVYTFGGTATGATVTGLPAGVTGSIAGTVFTISGTPSVAGVFNYTVTTAGTCSAITATGSITVTAQTITLTSAAGTNVQTRCINTVITNITYNLGGTASGATVTGLPAGVNGSFAGATFTISGTPTTAGVFNYTVTSTGTCSAVTATGSITVTAQTLALTSGVGTNIQTRCINSAITNITYSIGGTATGATVAGLPAGVSGSYAGAIFTISGTPTTAGVYNYTVTSTGTCSAVTATGSITVTAQTIALTSAAGTNSQTRCINSAITNITYSIGGTATGASVIGLPAGVTGSFASAVFTISGTPTIAGIYSYIVTTSGTCTNVTATGSITVTSQSIALTSAAGSNIQTRCINTAITSITYSTGGTSTGATVSGLPAGVSGTFAGGVFTISGTPTIAGVYNYTVTTSGTCASVTATGVITVTAQTIALSSAAGTNAQTRCINTPITNITYSIGGTATGATVTGLPSGVTGSFASAVFTISGTPAVTGIYNYTVTTSGTCANVTATGSITVTVSTITRTSAAGTDAQSPCVNNAIISITYSIGGSATGAGVTGLPAGVTGSFASGVFTISGTPTVGGTFSYVVTTTGTCTPATAMGTITVSAASIGGNIASASICSGGSGNLTLTGNVGAILRWESSSNGGTSWNNIANVTNIQSYSGLMQAVLFRALVRNGSCGTSVYSNIAKVGIHNLWTGVTSADWNTNSNWSDDQTPTTSCPDVVIPLLGGSAFYPSLTIGTATINNLVIQTGATMVVSGATLQVAGSITNNGILTTSNGTIELNGTAGAQTIAGSKFAGHVIRNLIISNSNGVSFSGTLDTVKITGLLSFGTSNAVLNTNNNLTLISSISGTASVGDLTNGGINSGNNIIGNATVERYIPNHPKAWQFLAVPTMGQSIKAAWQEGNTTLSNSLNPGYGTIITSNLSSAIALGFDVYTPSGPTMKSYNPVINGWDGVASMGIQITNKKGYMFFVRGDRSVTSASAPSTATTLRTTGKLFTTGADAPPATTVLSGKLESVGNPYASAIDFRLVTKPNTIDDKFYVWDPLLTNNYNGLGGYQTISLVNGWRPIPGGTANYNSNIPSPSIQSGQAFMVYSTSGGGALSFTEQCKVNSNISVNREINPVVNMQFLRLNLYNGPDTNSFLSDGNVVAFHSDFSNNADANDAQKLINTSENIGIRRGDKTFALEARKPVELQDTVFYTFSNLRRQAYRFRFKPENMDPGLTASLVDKFLNRAVEVSLTDSSFIDFSVTSDVASFALDRFYLIFRRSLPAAIANIPVLKVMPGKETTGKPASSISVYPNPVAGKTMFIQFVNQSTGSYELELSNKLGQVVYRNKLQLMERSGRQSIHLGDAVLPGNYQLKIISANIATTVKQVIIQ